MLSLHSFAVLWVLSLLHIVEPRKKDTSRFLEIAEAIVDASDGDDLTARRLVSIGHFESTFVVGALGDSGRSKGLFQTPTRLTPDDPYGQARLAARLIAYSIQQCGDLTLYASGQCGRGKREADHRESLAMALSAK